MTHRNRLSNRAVLSLTGKDRITFLQGLITGDVATLHTGHALWAGWLTPQGRLQHLIFLFATPDTLLIDCHAAHADALHTQLKRFRLRADVQIEPLTLDVLAGAPDEPPPHYTIACSPDPRLPAMGWRALCPSTPSSVSDDQTYLERRLTLGIPDDADIVAGQTLVLEANMDCLNGVSWEKGCYMGQEVTARTRYRGLIRRRLMPVTCHENHFGEENSLLFHDGSPVGELRSHTAHQGLAMIRREAWKFETLDHNGQRVQLHRPVWFPDLASPDESARP